MIAQISISAKERDCKPYPIIIEVWMRGNTITQQPRLEKKTLFSYCQDDNVGLVDPTVDTPNGFGRRLTIRTSLRLAKCIKELNKCC